MLYSFSNCVSTTKDETIDQWVKKRERDGEHRDEKEKFNWVRLRVSQSHFGRSLFFPRPAFKRTLMLLLLLLLLHLLLEKFSTDGDWEARLFVDRSMSFSWAVSTWLSAHRRVSLTHTHTHILYIRETDTKDTEIDGFPRLRTFESLVCLPSDYTSISVIPTGSE